MGRFLGIVFCRVSLKGVVFWVGLSSGGCLLVIVFWGLSSGGCLLGGCLLGGCLLGCYAGGLSSGKVVFWEVVFWGLSSEGCLHCCFLWLPFSVVLFGMRGLSSSLSCGIALYGCPHWSSPLKDYHLKSIIMQIFS